MICDLLYCLWMNAYSRDIACKKEIEGGISCKGVEEVHLKLRRALKSLELCDWRVTRWWSLYASGRAGWKEAWPSPWLDDQPPRSQRVTKDTRTKDV